MEGIKREKVSRKLRTLRGRRTLAEVAEAVGVTSQAVSQYETGQRMPTDEVKLRIAKYYGKTVDEIFFNPKVSKT